jgi:hypothetical protein
MRIPRLRLVAQTTTASVSLVQQSSICPNRVELLPDRLGRAEGLGGSDERLPAPPEATHRAHSLSPFGCRPSRITSTIVGRQAGER